MTESSNTPRRIRVPILTRVEGEGSLYVRIDGRKIEEVQLAIFEPPRLFEALLQGRPSEEAPDITARICGICPIAYQMTAVQALEQRFSIEIRPEIRALRRLMYCGEWIESHVLHVTMLQAPDFYGLDSGLELAKLFPDEVKRALRMKKIGNRLLEVLGGRAIHPVNLAIGGFYRLPKREELQQLIPDLEWGLQAAVETAKWVAGFSFPEFSQPYHYVSLSRPDEYAILDGDLTSSQGLKCDINKYENEFREEQVPHSTALHSKQLSTGEPYFVGPLARININRNQLSPTALEVSKSIGFPNPCYNPHMGIVARSTEVIHALEEGLEKIRNYRPILESRRLPVKTEQSEVLAVLSGCAATEAPRGTIYHRYEVDELGKITFAKIVPPTSQNQGQIESDLRRLLTTMIDQSDTEIALHCERLVRSYDPCISCSTHFLKLRIDRTPQKRIEP
ncbi:MAG: Ni/Fe hydrogenase subunit alpha [Pirellula sp.]|nr:Ni/Fe hydrogenase subunit alpha [Pirellula sp.]